MDNIQKQLKTMKSTIPDCTANRQRLRSILSDFVPTEKQKINSLLNAYDEDIENRLNTSSDKTLTSLQFIKILKDDYGMTEDNAFWAIETWCYILGYDEIAEAIKNIYPSKNNGNIVKPPVPQRNKLTLSWGMYLSGVDFPSGEIKLSAPTNSKEQIYYAILKKGSNNNEIITNGFFNSQAILYLKDGQRLEVRPKGTVELTFIGGTN